MGRVAQNKWEYARLHRKTVLWTLLITLLCIAAVFSLWLRGMQIADEGMAPTLRSGDVVLFDCLAKQVRTPARGDIYALQNGQRNKGLAGASLGRVIALPGETVEINRGNVYIDGVFLSESAYVQYADADMAPVKLKSGEFFLLPDCRTYMQLDPAAMIVTADALLGRAALRVSPLSRLALF